MSSVLDDETVPFEQEPISEGNRSSKQIVRLGAKKLDAAERSVCRRLFNAQYNGKRIVTLD